jgi:MYXO-CTERM domain-containing protein
VIEKVYRPYGRSKKGRGVGLLGTLASAGCLAILDVLPAYADAHGGLYGAHDDSPGAWIGLALVALFGLGLGLAARRRRSVGLAALAFFIGLLGIESAVHSVHHLSDPASAASCAVFTASQHTPAATAEASDLGAPTEASEPPAPTVTERIRPLPAFSCHEGRAPPALFSA